MNIYEINNNVYDTINSIVKNGVAAIEGTKTQAINYANIILESLRMHPEIEPSIGYQNVANAGYLYYIFDLNRFPIGDAKLKAIIDKIDAANA